MDRRKFLGTATAVSATLIAGCGGSSGDGAAGDGSTTDGDATDGSDGGTTASTGAFRLLISDRPADIGDFDSLDVTFDSARVFKAESDEDEDAEATDTEATSSETETETGTETDTETETETETGTDSETETETETETEKTDESDTADAEESDEDGEGGFETFDLDSPTVDLTEVVGDKAIGVLDGELETGRYAKIELSVEDVEGVVEGETVPVKVPSNKLQITKPFEITAEGTVEFVFDINVVKKGPNGYNLLPVIGESGVAGKDVEVEEVEADEQTTQTSTEAET